MATIKVKPKVEKEPKDVAGRIIGFLFLLMLLAGGYFMFDMFSQIDKVNENIQGEWDIPAQLGEDSCDCWQFTTDGKAEGNTGVALSFTKDKKTGERSNIVEYTYVIEEYTDSADTVRTHIVVTTSGVKRSEMVSKEIRITSLSKMEMSVTFVNDRFHTDITRLTRPTMF